MRYEAVAFDTGGTVLDWHGSLVDELAAVSAWQGGRSTGTPSPTIGGVAR